MGINEEYFRQKENIVNKSYQQRAMYKPVSDRSIDREMAMEQYQYSKQRAGGKAAIGADIAASFLPQISKAISGIAPAIADQISGGIAGSVAQVGMKGLGTQKKMAFSQVQRSMGDEMGMAGRGAQAFNTFSLANRSMMSANLMKALVTGQGGASSSMWSMMGGPMMLAMMAGQMGTSMLAAKKMRQITAIRKRANQDEQKHSMSKFLESQLSMLASQQQIQPADQMQIRLLMWIESHLSLLGLMYEMQDLEMQRKEKGTTGGERRLDEMMYGKGANLSPLGKALNTVEDTLSTFILKFDPVTQLMNFVFGGGKTPRQALMEIQYGKGESADERFEAIDQASRKGITVAQARLLTTDVSTMVSYASTYEEKMYLLSSLQTQLAQVQAQEMLTMRKGMGIIDNTFYQQGMNYEEGVFGRLMFGITETIGNIPGLNAIGNIFKTIGTVGSTLRNAGTKTLDFGRKMLYGQEYMDVQDPEKLKQMTGQTKSIQEAAQEFTARGMPRQFEALRTLNVKQLVQLENIYGVTDALYRVMARSVGEEADYEFKDLRRQDQKGLVWDELSGQWYEQPEFEKMVKSRSAQRHAKREEVFRSTGMAKILSAYDVTKGIFKGAGAIAKGDASFGDLPRIMDEAVGGEAGEAKRASTAAKAFNTLSQMLGDIRTTFSERDMWQKEEERKRAVGGTLKAEFQTSLEAEREALRQTDLRDRTAAGIEDAVSGVKSTAAILGGLAVSSIPLIGPVLGLAIAGGGVRTSQMKYLDQQEKRQLKYLEKMAGDVGETALDMGIRVGDISELADNPPENLYQLLATVVEKSGGKKSIGKTGKTPQGPSINVQLLELAQQQATNSDKLVQGLIPDKIEDGILGQFKQATVERLDKIIECLDVNNASRGLSQGANVLRRHRLIEVGEAGRELISTNEYGQIDHILGARQTSRILPDLSRVATVGRAQTGTPGSASFADKLLRRKKNITDQAKGVMGNLGEMSQGFLPAILGGGGGLLGGLMMPFFGGIGTAVTGGMLGAGLGLGMAADKARLPALKKAWEQSENEKAKADPSYKKIPFDPSKLGFAQKHKTSLMMGAGTLGAMTLGGPLMSLLGGAASMLLPGMFGTVGGGLLGGLGMLAGPLAPIIGTVIGLSVMAKKTGSVQAKKKMEQDAEEAKKRAEKDFSSLSYEEKLMRIADIQDAIYQSSRPGIIGGGFDIAKLIGATALGGMTFGPLGMLYGAGGMVLSKFLRNRKEAKNYRYNVLQDLMNPEDGEPIKAKELNRLFIDSLSTIEKIKEEQAKNEPEARAKGGPTKGGKPYWVGEQGPELFTPGVSGAITSSPISFLQVISKDTTRIRELLENRGTFWNDIGKMMTKEREWPAIFGTAGESANMLMKSIATSLTKERHLPAIFGGKLGGVAGDFVGQIAKSIANTLTKERTLPPIFSTSANVIGKIGSTILKVLTTDIMKIPLINLPFKTAGLIGKGIMGLFKRGSDKTVSLLPETKEGKVAVGQMYKDMRRGMRRMWRTAEKSGRTVWRDMMDFGGAGLDMISGAGKTISGGIGGAWKDIKGGVSGAWKDVTSGASKVYDDIKGAVTLRGLRGALGLRNPEDNIKEEDIDDEKTFWKKNIFYLRKIHSRLPKSTLGRMTRAGANITGAGIGMAGQLMDVMKGRKEKVQESREKKMVDTLTSIDKNTDELEELSKGGETSGKKKGIFHFLKMFSGKMLTVLGGIAAALGAWHMVKGIVSGPGGKVAAGAIQSGLKFVDKSTDAIKAGKEVGMMGKLAAGTGKVVGSVAKTLGKVPGLGWLMKGGGLALKALKKIPGLGLVLGIGLSIPKFKDGDIIGGVLEIASGAASLFPGVGTLVSVGIDALSMFRDKYKSEQESGKKGFAGKTMDFIKDAGKTMLKYSVGWMPFIGPRAISMALGGEPVEHAVGPALLLEKVMKEAKQGFKNTKETMGDLFTKIKDNAKDWFSNSFLGQIPFLSPLIMKHVFGERGPEAVFAGPGGAQVLDANTTRRAFGRKNAPGYAGGTLQMDWLADLKQKMFNLTDSRDGSQDAEQRKRVEKEGNTPIIVAGNDNPAFIPIPQPSELSTNKIGGGLDELTATLFNNSCIAMHSLSTDFAFGNSSTFKLM